MQDGNSHLRSDSPWSVGPRTQLLDSQQAADDMLMTAHGGTTTRGRLLFPSLEVALVDAVEVAGFGLQAACATPQERAPKSFSLKGGALGLTPSAAEWGAAKWQWWT